MRMVYNVIEQMMAEIPDEGDYIDLKLELEKIRRDTLYKAPEQMPEYFQAVANLLNDYLGEPDTDWKKKVANIFADKES